MGNLHETNLALAEEVRVLDKENQDLLNYIEELQESLLLVSTIIDNSDWIIKLINKGIKYNEKRVD